jgi:single-strand selective monofunctional uracil DNA glycosylase
MPTETSETMHAITRDLVRGVNRLKFAAPVAYVYNPLDYAAASHALYIDRFAAKRKRVVFLGMNPGPFGMAQTGVPFGEIAMVRDWMKIEAPVKKPEREHPKRPVLGFECTRSEVSGTRLWGLFRERFGSAAKFFARHYVANFCPLVFMGESGANITPDKLPGEEREKLFALCDEHLRRLVEILAPAYLVGVGKFAEKRALSVLHPESVRRGRKAGSASGAASTPVNGPKPPRITTILHPSPASPAANRGWSGTARAQMIEAGIWPS